MKRTHDKKPSESITSAKSTTLNLQTRPFAPLQTDSSEDHQITDSASTETKDTSSKNILQRLISTSNPESAAPIQRKPHNRLQSSRMAIQAKLSIGKPNDKYEQEADATAAKVVQQINAPQNQSVQRQGEMQEEDELQMKPISTIQRDESMEEDELQMKPLVQRRENVGGGEASTDLESSIQRARGSGQSLDAGLQTKMGQAMGADFSGVKVHTDSQSDQLNQSIQAKAFTTGQDVFFRQGAYEPSSKSGQELIAHELTHTIQQGGVSRTVQRQFEPEDSNWWNDIASVEIMGGGMANKGIFKVTDANGKTMVLKFTDEDPRRAAFADRVLSSAGVGNPGANGIEVTSNDGQAIVNQILQVGDNTVAAKINTARTAQYVNAMKMVGGQDASIFGEMDGNKSEYDKRGDVKDYLGVSLKDKYDESLAKANSTGWMNKKDGFSYLTSANFLQGLGRMFVADAVLGNGDRIAQDVTKVKYGEVTINASNFRVFQDSVGAVDNDTELFSKDLLQSIDPNIDTKSWANLLINGSDRHHKDNDQSTRATQGLETLFNENVFKLVYNEIPLKALPESMRAKYHIKLPEDVFITHFKAGIKLGLEGILADAPKLIQSAKDIGGNDKGDGLIDPEALELKLFYLKLRTDDTSPMDAGKALSLSQAKVGGFDSAIDAKLHRVIQFGKQRAMGNDMNIFEIKASLSSIDTKTQEEMVHISKRNKTAQGFLGDTGAVDRRLEAARFQLLMNFANAAVQSNPQQAANQTIVSAKMLLKNDVGQIVYATKNGKTNARTALSNIGLNVKRWWYTDN